MQTWVALFRGINVGGKNILPMAKLKLLLPSLNCTKVRTYIQSGNVIFESASKSKANLTKRLLDAVEGEFDFRPKVLLLTAGEFLAAKTKNPFPKAVAEPKTLHFYFLDAVPEAPNTAAIRNLATETESFQLIDRIFYLHTPEGIGQSKLASNAERKLGVTATARNYRTVEKIADLLATR